MSRILTVLPLFGCVIVCQCGGGQPSQTRQPGDSGGATTVPPATGGSAGEAIGSGGIAGTGGSLAMGGIGSTGGSTASGGTAVTPGALGGATDSGGTPATGGMLTTGGTPATGGIAATGGTKANGGSVTTGGSKAAGGTAVTGGSKATGGSTATGGSAATGGTTATGGAATGGSTSSTAGSGAPESSPLGYGRATTGGGNATGVNVADMTAMQAAIDAYSGSGGLVLKYTGKFNFASISDPCVQHTLPSQKVEIKKKSNITILGADGSAANFGIHIAASSSNIIIRNMTIGLTPGGGDSDIISLEGMSGGIPTNVWIDHNELFTSMAECTGAGDTAFDGMIDIKKGADNVTISYNYMHDHHKMSLNGYSDSDNTARHVTFHHNLFENVGSRTPLQRFGYSHMLNNYFYKVLVSGVNVRMGGYALVEANYFETVLNPVTSRDSSAIGYWDLRNNNLASKADVAAGNKFGITWDNGNSGTVNATDWTTTAAFPAPLGYSYTADPFQCVHDGLRAVAGAGKSLATLKCK